MSSVPEIDVFLAAHAGHREKAKDGILAHGNQSLIIFRRLLHIQSELSAYKLAKESWNEYKENCK